MSKSAVSRCCYVCGRLVRGVGVVPAVSTREQRRRYKKLGVVFCGQTCFMNSLDFETFFFAAHGSFMRRQFVRIAGDVMCFIGRCYFRLFSRKK